MNLEGSEPVLFGLMHHLPKLTLEAIRIPDEGSAELRGIADHPDLFRVADRCRVVGQGGLGDDAGAGGFLFCARFLGMPRVAKKPRHPGYEDEFADPKGSEEAKRLAREKHGGGEAGERGRGPNPRKYSTINLPPRPGWASGDC